MHDRNWTVVHYPHKLWGLLRFFGKLQYCINDLHFNIILKVCILFVVNGGERYRKYDLMFRRQWKRKPINWKVKPCACVMADGFKLFIGTCRFQFASFDRSLKQRKQLLSALKLVECRASICCLFVALLEDVPHLTNEFYIKIYTDISITLLYMMFGKKTAVLWVRVLCTKTKNELHINKYHRALWFSGMTTLNIGR